MEEKLLELIELKNYYQDLCITYEGNQTNLGKLETITKTLRDIFTSSQTTKFTESTIFHYYASLDSMKVLPAVHGGVDNVNKFERAKEIAQDWVDYKNGVLANLSSKAYITVALNNTGNVVIDVVDPYDLS